MPLNIQYLNVCHLKQQNIIYGKCSFLTNFVEKHLFCTQFFPDPITSLNAATLELSTYLLPNNDSLINHLVISRKGKVVPLQSWSGPEGSRKLRFPDFMTTAQDGGKVVSLTHWPPLPPGNTDGTHFCQRLSRPQSHSATGRIKFQ